METPARINYIFVDFENTQVINLELIANKSVQVYLLIGERQKHLPITLVRQLLEFVNKVHLIESAGSGKNALDFILAYQIGLAVQQDPLGYYHIISKDKGFDPLIAHLKQQKIFASRHNEFAQVPALINSQKLPVVDRILFLQERLIKNEKAKPTKRDSLINYISSAFSKQLDEQEVLDLMNTMQKRKLITINSDNKVTYCL